jgi:hypothetical protein
MIDEEDDDCSRCDGGSSSFSSLVAAAAATTANTAAPPTTERLKTTSKKNGEGKDENDVDDDTMESLIVIFLGCLVNRWNKTFVICGFSFVRFKFAEIVPCFFMYIYMRQFLFFLLIIHASGFVLVFRWREKKRHLSFDSSSMMDFGTDNSCS